MNRGRTLPTFQASIFARAVATSAFAAILAAASFSGAANTATPIQQAASQPTDFCGAGGRGCITTPERYWMAIGNDLLGAEFSSAEITWYAAACAKHANLHQRCRTDARKVALEAIPHS